MNPPLHPDHPATALSRRVLSADDLECAIVTLGPGEATPCPDAHWSQEHILFTLEGSAAVQMDDITVLLNREEAVHIAPGKNTTITADPAGWARLLRIDITRRTIVEPPIFAAPGVQSFASTR